MRQAAGQASRQASGQVSISFWTWQHQKPSNSARLPQFSKLTTSKAKPFCEPSFKNGKLSAELTASCQWVLRFFHSTCLSTAPATKKWCQVIRSAAPVTQNHLSKPEDLMLPNATLLRKSAPGPLNSSDEHVSCTAPATENASLQILFKGPTPAIVFGHATKPSRFAHFWQPAQSLAPATRKRIWTSKSAPYPSVFWTFDFEMCFAPQRRAFFRHLNFQKWCERDVFLAFSLAHVLRTTMVCNFSSIIWPDGSAPAALASLLFDPPEPHIMEKTQCYAAFLPFRAWIFFFLRVSLFWSSLLLFSSLLWLFPSLLFICPFCRKFDF